MKRMDRFSFLPEAPLALALGYLIAFSEWLAKDTLVVNALASVPASNDPSIHSRLLLRD